MGMTAPKETVLIVDNSDHRQAGGWFVNCLGASVPAEVRGREEVDEAEWRAVVISGSERSIFEDLPWLERQLAWVRDLLDGGVPVLGVCFGHQLIFRALYGKDVLARRAVPEVGWLPVRLAEHPAFEGVEPTIRPYNFHFDEVVEVPAGWEVLASSEACRVHAVRHRELPVLSLQFHPEVTPEDGAASILRGGTLLGGYGLDAEAVTARRERGPGYYPEIVRDFVASRGAYRDRNNLT